MAPPSVSATLLVVMSQPRKPGFLTGTDIVDVEDWISLYEVTFADFLVYFKGTALTWYEMNEATLTNWDVCKARLLEAFGKPFARQIRAKTELTSHAQMSTEPHISYIQDVMTEQDKVGNLLKGIADDTFHLLICKDCTTVDAILKEWRRFEKAKSRCITQPFQRRRNTAATSSCEAPSPPPPSLQKNRTLCFLWAGIITAAFICSHQALLNLFSSTFSEHSVP